ncbi:ABC transporter ATP-binding protein [Derxia gummosa]|uniref:ABC transporter ATP-binding protein n=1 Tax=Derxia gummosa DSM 723 TaxID=1121388 RepID=A0A8B6X6L7_9BURK|nr:ABC transporter ATP-binding protein [Derxia gummosa]
MTDKQAPPRLALRGITKRYPSVVANDGVSLSVAPGEIHAVLGENGAGKSTLMKIIYGVTRPDAGEVLWEGRPVHLDSPGAARACGIGMVFQHFSLFETLTVAENIALFLGESAQSPTLDQRVREVSEHYGLPLDPQRLVHSMSVGERQRVEIVRCLLQKPRLLILDEPTSVLTPQAVQRLFGTLRQLAAEGCSILYISHKLEEIRSLCDSATVLRNGKVSGHAIPRQETAASLARMMIGGDLSPPGLAPREPDEVRLALSKLSIPAPDPFSTALSDISLELRSGEIVGIAGVSGNGQKELMAAISGERRGSRADEIVLLGKPVGLLGPAQRRNAGLGFVPEERLGRGAVPSLSLTMNAILTGFSRGMARRGLLDVWTARDFSNRVIQKFKVKCGGEASVASSLSGGNLQKFIVGRETSHRPPVLVVAQPTWGVDVGAAQLIHQALIDLRAEGCAILVVSEELDELRAICDRIAVICAGRLSRSLPTAETTTEQLGAWMGGKFDFDPRTATEADLVQA